MNNRKRTIFSFPGMPFVLACLAIASQAAMAADDGHRVSRTSQGLVTQGGAAASGEPSRDEYQALVVSGDRVKPKRAMAQQKASTTKTPAAVVSAANTDFWIYAADVELFADQDRDGYYSAIDLLFDADTYYDIADVYAVLYLSYEYGEWNEYAETATFTIFGASGADEYVVETDLVEGYPSGNYDLLIELYDAYDNAFVASFGPDDTSELAILPLEDAGRDSPTGTTHIVVNSAGGGSLSWLFLLGLAAVGALRQKR